MRLAKPYGRLAVHRDQRGIALVSVVGIASILLVLVTILAFQSVTNLRQVGTESRYEKAVQVADAGVDAILFRLDVAERAGTPWATTEPAPPAFTSVASERAWVLERAAAASSTATRIVSTGEGDWIAVRPALGTKKVFYVVGYVPSYSAAASVRETRVVRVEYTIGTSSSDYSILAEGNLQVGPEHTDTRFAGIHSNGNITLTGSGAIDGAVTASGSYSKTGTVKIGDTSASGGGYPTASVPSLPASSFYSLSQYDMCPDGTVRPGPAYPGTPKNTSGIPCDPALSAIGFSSSTGFRGWVPQGVTGTHGQLWKHPSNTEYEGVYYFHQGSAWTAKDLKDWNVTLIASSSGSGCSKTGGDIIVRDSDQDKWNAHSGGAGILMLADRDIDHGNHASTTSKTDFTNGWAKQKEANGLVYAGEHFRNGKDVFDLFGALVIKGGSCNSSGSPVSSNVTGHLHLGWDSTIEVPVTTVQVMSWEEI